MKFKENSGRDISQSCSILCMAVLCLMIPVAASTVGDGLEGPISAPVDPATRGQINAMLGSVPLFFVPNEGQTDPAVLFTCKGTNHMVYFTKDRMVYSLPSEDGYGRTVVVERFSGSNPGPILEGIDPLETRVSYFTGEESEWHTNITPFGAIACRDLYPGIDVIYRGEPGAIKREFLVEPEADPYRIRMTCKGAGQVRMAGDGGLVLSTGSGELHETKPACYQAVNGVRVEIPCRFDVREDDGSVSFYIGSYDHSLPLIIDPEIVYCGYIGGSGYDYGRAIAVDSTGNAYITGDTASAADTFPETVGPDLTQNGGTYDAFVAKVNAAGNGLTYCGYIGGSGTDNGNGIAVDAEGNAYVTGMTTSTEASFPETVGPDLTHNGGPYDAFVAKVNPDGTALVYCGYIGGAHYEYGNGIAVDTAGNAYVTGDTGSSAGTFPETVGPDLSHNGGFYDGFVAKVNTAGTGLTYCGYLGGNDYDSGKAVAVDSAGNAYVTGYTRSSETSFPDTGGPDLSYNGLEDAFVAKVNTAGSALSYCGYIGGSGEDIGSGIAVDSSGNAYITGWTNSTGTTFPETVGPDLSYNGGDHDAFVAKVNPSGSSLVYCGYIGGSDYDRGYAIGLDESGNAYITGATYSASASFPVRLGPDFSQNGQRDAFIAKVNATGSRLIFCGYIGGSGVDEGEGIALGPAGSVYIAGYTYSSETTFPVKTGPDLTFNNNMYTTDAFIAKIIQAKCGIGLFRPSTSRWYFDYDNNGLSNYQVTWGESTDIPVTGDWDGDGYDENGLFRPSTARWYLDHDINGLSDFQVSWGESTDIPVTGDWDNDGYDEIGLFRPSTAAWYLDYDNSGGSDLRLSWGDSSDKPITGDWDNDGYDEIGLFRPSTVTWYLDYDNSGRSDFQVSWGATTDIPVTRDWDLDGYDEIGLFRPSTARWYLDYDNNGLSNYQVTWGTSTDKPVTGKWN